MVRDFRDGVRASVPISIGVIPVALAFGMTARASGLSLVQASALSFFVFAGASQFVAVNMMVSGASLLGIAVTTFVLNFRHFLMSAALSRKVLPGTPKWALALLSYGLTDETFVVASFREGAYSVPFMSGLTLSFWLSWGGATVVGCVAASSLPPLIQDSMGIALYAMFLALVIPALNGEGRYFLVMLCAMAVSVLFDVVPALNSLGGGTRVIVASVTASALGAAFILPKADDGRGEGGR